MEAGGGQPGQQQGQEAGAFLGASEGPEERSRLVLHAVELDAFKSYRQHTLVGSPFGQFTAVVGPNGTGKSVVGEAIAFALGGNARMMRAHNLGALVNHAAGPVSEGDTARQTAAAAAGAEVVLHFAIVTQLQHAGEECSSGGSANGSAAADSSCIAAEAESGSGAAVEQATGRLLIRRRVSRAGRSDFAVMRLPPQSAGAGEENSSSGAESNGTTRDGSSMPTGGWRAVTQAALRDLLAPFGLQTEAVDRFVVMQHRQAVQAADPAALSHFLELLIGTAPLAEQLAELEREAAAKASAYDEEEERIAELELRRQRLAPEVARWRRYEAEQLRYSQRKVEVLTEQAGLLERQLTSSRREALASQQQVDSLSTEQASAKQEADALLGSKAAAAEQARAADKARARLAKLAAAAQLQAAKLGVQLKVAEAAAAAGGGAGGKSGKGKLLETRTRQAEKEAAKCREALEAATTVLECLKAEEAAGHQKVRQLSAEMGAAPGGPANLAAELAAAQGAAHAAGSAQAAARRWHEQCSARVAALEAELAAVLASTAAAHERQLEAAQQVQQLRVQAQEVAPLVQGAQARLQAAWQRQYALLASAHEAQAALAAAEGELAVLERQLAGPQQAERDQTCAAGVATPQRQTPDQAVAALAAACSPGTFHGRLHSVLRLAPQAVGPRPGAGPGGAGVAVNAALRELCNLSSLLVVADRATAQLAVSHFERHRVGVATCKILSELSGPGGGAPVPAAPAAGPADGADGLSPLAAHVLAHPRVPGAASLAGHLFNNWWLARDRQAAVAAVRAGRGRGGQRRSIVTQQGEVFKADGEIVGARQPPANLLPYLLTSALAPPGQAGPAAGPTCAAASAAKMTAADRLRLQEEAAALREQVQQAQRAVQQAERESEAAAAAAGELEQRQAATAAQLAAADRRLQQLQGVGGGSQRQGSAVQRQARQLEQQLAAARQETAGAWVAEESADVELRAAEVQLADAERAYKAAMRSSSGGAALLKAEKDLGMLQQQAAEAAAAAGAAEAALASATRQLQKLEAAQRAAWEAAAEAERLRCELEGLQAKAAEEQEEAARLAEAARQHTAECSQLESEWRAAVKKHESVTRRCQQQQASLRELQAAQEQRRKQLAAVQAALAEAGPAAAAAQAAESEHKRQEGSVEGAQQQQGEAGSSGSSSESEAERPARQRRRLARPSSLASLLPPAPSAAAGASSRAASTGVMAAQASARSARSKRRLVESSSSESGSDIEEHEAEVQAAAGDTAGAAGSSKRAAPSARRQSQGAAQSAAPSRRAAGGCGSHKRQAEVQSDSDFEPAPSSRHAGASSAAASELQPGQTQGRLGTGRRRAAAGAAAAAPEHSWGEGEVEAALDGLAAREQQLQALRASLLETALQEDAAAAAELEAACRRLDSLADSLAQLEGRQGSLQEERYARFHAALQSVNGQLTGIYSRLTGGQGDAYCSYTQDRLAAFTDGAVFHVRPDRQRWRPFAALSGGQQALATLALCFALQAVAPSPFYFFDEIDCALDTANAARVADYIVSQQAQQQGPQARQGAGPDVRAGAQFLVVSHKPQVYERASCLVGVTSRHQASEAVTVHLGPADCEAHREAQ